MNDIQSVRRERPGGSYLEIRLNRPAKGNAITSDMLEGLAAIVRDVAGDRSIGTVVLRGEGKFFCTGGDIGEWSALSPEDMRERWILRGIEVFGALAALPQPVIAAINGHAFGGGLELALHADLRIALISAKLGTPEVKLGMIAGWGGVRRLAETIGLARARDLVLLGDPLSAAQALDWSLITAVAETVDVFEARLIEWIDRLLANGPNAMALSKNLLAAVHADRRHEHAAAAGQALATAECAEGVRSFREKRLPVFVRQRKAP